MHPWLVVEKILGEDEPLPRNWQTDGTTGYDFMDEVSAVMHDRTDNTYLLPATTQFETYGSLTSSNRSIQWRDKIIEPLFESKPDHEIMYLFARKLGFGNELVKNYEMNGDEPLIEDILREINRSCWTIGYTGQTPERVGQQRRLVIAADQEAPPVQRHRHDNVATLQKTSPGPLQPARQMQHRRRGQRGNP